MISAEVPRGRGLSVLRLLVSQIFDLWIRIQRRSFLLQRATFGADEVPQVGLLSAGRSEQLQGFRIVAGLLLISAAVWHTKALHFLLLTRVSM